MILLLAVMSCTTTTSAQTIPNNVKGAFMKLYPNVKSVKWEVEDDKYEASFKHKGNKTSVLFNSDASIKETEANISVTDLPAKAQKYASAKGEIEETAKIVSSNGSITYEAEVNDVDYLFDETGNFISSSKNKEEDHDDRD